MKTEIGIVHVRNRGMLSQTGAVNEVRAAWIPAASCDVTALYWAPRAPKLFEAPLDHGDDNATDGGSTDPTVRDSVAGGGSHPVGEDVVPERDARVVGTTPSWKAMWSSLSRLVSRAYSESSGTACPELLEFRHGPATYLFDNSGVSRAERTVLAAGVLEAPTVERDASYQSGYPLPNLIAHRPVDRGHYIPYSGGGLFGPNMFVQDRALNRGWSREGRLYRALERRAVLKSGALLFARPTYVDSSDVPVTVDLGVIDGSGCRAYRFRNHYGLVPEAHPATCGSNDHVDTVDELAVALNGAVSAQIGALGEETAAIFLADTAGTTIVALGDAAMPRDGAAQDLDLVAIVDGELVVFEVKTRFLSQSAGRRTRAGNLTRPRLRRSPSKQPRQGSQDYVSSRLSHVVDVNDDYEGVEVRVVAVDLQLMQIQQFAVNDIATRLTPLGAPADCLNAARTAFARIVERRGYL